MLTVCILIQLLFTIGLTTQELEPTFGSIFHSLQSLVLDLAQKALTIEEVINGSLRKLVGMDESVGELPAPLLTAEDCEECTDEIHSAINVFKTIMSTILPYTTTDVQPCQRCELGGVNDFTITPGTKVCPEAVVGGERQTTIDITYNKLIFDCKCELECGTSEWNENQSVVTCASAGYKLLGIDKITGPQQCQADKLNPKLCANGKTSGTVHAELPGMRYRFTLARKIVTNKASIKSVILMSTDYNDLSVRCSQDDPNFEAVCKCLTATNLYKTLIAKSLQLLLFCDVKKENKLLLQLICDGGDY